ncbi:MAG: helix-turn-helix domain-containing protein [Anaerolineae bacterium]|nr:helix-turn-helix domain-containing protein [Anaerolineae bacterium]
MDNVTLFVLPQEQLQHLGKADSCFVAALLHVYSQRLESLARLSISLSTWTVADRINDVLLTYADRIETRLVITLTYEELAALSGTVREVVIRHLACLEKVGTARIEPGQITLMDTGALTLPCRSSEGEPA